MLSTARYAPVELERDEAVLAPPAPPAEAEEPKSVWERVAIVGTALLAFQLALLALIGL